MTRHIAVVICGIELEYDVLAILCSPDGHDAVVLSELFLAQVPCPTLLGEERGFIPGHAANGHVSVKY